MDTNIPNIYPSTINRIDLRANFESILILIVRKIAMNADALTENTVFTDIHWLEPKLAQFWTRLQRFL